MDKQGSTGVTGAFPNAADAIDSLVPGWSALLAQWLQVIEHQAWRGTGDCSWWYGERASVSQLAGAAWTLPDGWALQEYAGTRGTEGRARIDLAVEAKDGLRSAIEAKQIWPRLSTRAEDVHRDIEAALRAAAEQLGEGGPWILHHDDYDLVAAVFVTPRLLPNDVAQPTKIATLTKALVSVPGTVVAWSFPRWAHDVVSPTTGDLYPGIGIVARLVRARAARCAR